MQVSQYHNHYNVATYVWRLFFLYKNSLHSVVNQPEAFMRYLSVLFISLLLPNSVRADYILSNAMLCHGLHQLVWIERAYKYESPETFQIVFDNYHNKPNASGNTECLTVEGDSVPTLELLFTSKMQYEGQTRTLY
jgi:hypothetical protein